MNGKPEPGSELEHLQQQLKSTLRQAGNPTYREISNLSGDPLSPSTISRVVTGKLPPKWKNLSALLSALSVPAKDIRSVWHPLWVKAMNEADPIGSRLETTSELLHPGPQDLADRNTCRKCGAAIADQTLHADWHQRLERAGGLLEALEKSTKRSLPATARGAGSSTRPNRRDSSPGPANPAPARRQP